MKVAVFGGSGFVGSHVADALSSLGNKVIIFDRKASPYLSEGQDMIIGDILDEKSIEDAISGCQVVYNFAGVSDIDESSEDPINAIKANILGTTIILDACRKAKIKRFVFASSLYVYSKRGSFYRSTKQACELLIENYQEIFKLPYTIIRYGSLFGPRADEKNAINKFVRQALTEGKISRYGDGEELREYIHILDAAKGSVDILSDEFENQCVIISGYQQMKIKDLLLMMKEMFDNRITIEYLPPLSDHHYEITPYTFIPRTGKRLLNKTYLDIGQGVLDYIHDLYKQFNSTHTEVV